MTSEQDDSIISEIIRSDSRLTAYGISQRTNISVPQVQYRLNKLVEKSVVRSSTEDSKKTYEVHPVLKSKKDIDGIASRIKEIVDIIDEVEYTSADGIRILIDFILSRTEIKDRDAEEASDSKEEIIMRFRRELEIYAGLNGLIISNVKGWTDHKIIWMALNERKCACSPDKRECPCKEGLDEVKSKGQCLCSVFLRR